MHHFLTSWFSTLPNQIARVHNIGVFLTLLSLTFHAQPNSNLSPLLPKCIPNPATSFYFYNPSPDCLHLSADSVLYLPNWSCFYFCPIVYILPRSSQNNFCLVLSFIPFGIGVKQRISEYLQWFPITLDD